LLLFPHVGSVDLLYHDAGRDQTYDMPLCMADDAKANIDRPNSTKSSNALMIAADDFQPASCTPSADSHGFVTHDGAKTHSPRAR
jgi:hypothetical protein